LIPPPTLPARCSPDLPARIMLSGASHLDLLTPSCSQVLTVTLALALTIFPPIWPARLAPLTSTCPILCSSQDAFPEDADDDDEEVCFGDDAFDDINEM
jgi:hypothetical protein